MAKRTTKNQEEWEGEALTSGGQLLRRTGSNRRIA